MEENGSGSEDTNVKVAVRCRPFNSKEKANGEISCVKITSDHITLVDPRANGEEHSFAFDIIFDQDSVQTSLWDAIGVPTLKKAFNGYNGTIFAYGQTGSGKTWSMQGADGELLQGIIPRMNRKLFERISVEKEARPSMQFLVTVSYFEIYNEVIFDLLDANDRKKRGVGGGGNNNNKGGLEIKEHPVLGVYVKGLQEIVVETPEKLQDIVDQGMRSRTVASTQMNADSSRSHSVFTIMIHQKDPEDETKNVFAKVNLVDLAGSERVKSTGATGATLKEGANINKSLSELGNVINALVEKAKGKKGVFIPYRNSKLTRVLQESLGGNSITSMLAALSPAACNFEETLSTLKYANRAKAIKVNAVKNDEASQISRLNDEIRTLKEKLLNQRPESAAAEDTSTLEERHRHQLKELEEAMRSTWEEKAKVSEEHEKERKRLEAEQRVAEKQLVAARERNWRLLEEKNDIDMALSHLRELSKRDTTISTQIGTWMARLRELTKLEQNLGEQDTVIQVYRAALEKDSTTLLPTGGSGGYSARSPLNQQTGSSSSTTQPASSSSLAFPNDKASLSLWRQFRDKFNAILNEVKKWTKMQDALLQAIEEFSSALLLTQQSFAERVESSLAGAGSAGAQAGGKGGSSSSNSTETAAATATAAATVLSPEEAVEITRGLQLLRKQAKSKQSKLLSGVSSTRSSLIDFGTMSADLVQSLSQHERFIEESMRNEAQAQSESDEEMHTALVALQSQEKALVVKLKRCASALLATFALSSPRQAGKGSAAATTGTAAAPVAPKTPRSGRAREEIAISSSEFRVKCSASSAISTTPGTVTKNATSEGGFSAPVDGTSYWGLKPSSSSSSSSSVSPRSSDEYLEIALHRPRQLSALVLQGGQATVPLLGDDGKKSKNKSEDLDGGTTSSSSKGRAASISPSEITLPCGISLANCSTDVDETAAAIADIMSWEALIKKNPPDKFLRRPPVRFLFDLFQYVGKEVAPGLLPESSVCAVDWETVGASKQSKVDFMSAVISTVSAYLGVEPATTAASIVTGADAPLTCSLLQHLAIAVKLFQTRSAAADGKAANNKSSSASKSSQGGMKEGSSSSSEATTAVVPAWPTEVRLYLSSDGDEWSAPQTISTGLRDAVSKTAIPLTPLLTKLGIKGGALLRVRIQPIKWSSPSSSSDVQPTAMRVDVRAYADEESTDTAAESSLSSSPRSPRATATAAASSGKGSGSGSGSGGELIPPDRVMAALSTMHETTETMIAAIDFIGKIDEMRKAKKQEEIRKQMEGLANEKQALEQRLATEKKALTNEKQDLSDQLKDALLKLKETQDLLERERAVKTQMELDQSQLEAEKSQLQVALQEQSDETVALKTELLKLQANKEKDRVLVETLRGQVAEGEQKLYDLTSEAEDSATSKQQWESERDDLLNQIAVLTEERDTAHGNEESFFEQLAERTQDLERLQESYVDMTDRCNDAMDEISELREQLEGYKEALATASHASSNLGNSNSKTNLKVGRPHSSRSSSTADEGASVSGSATAAAGGAGGAILVSQSHSQSQSARKESSSSILPAISAAAVRSPRSQQISPRANTHTHTTTQMLGRPISPTQSQSVNGSRLGSFMDKSSTTVVSATRAANITSSSFSAAEIAAEAERERDDVDRHRDDGKENNHRSSSSSFLPSVVATTTAVSSTGGNSNTNNQSKGASKDQDKIQSSDNSNNNSNRRQHTADEATAAVAEVDKNKKSNEEAEGETGEDNYDDDFDDYGGEEFED